MTVSGLLPYYSYSVPQRTHQSQFLHIIHPKGLQKIIVVYSSLLFYFLLFLFLLSLQRTPHSPYHPSQNSPHRRIPTGLEGGSLEDALVWLLKQCGRPQQLARNTCMQLLVSLAPHAKGTVIYRDCFVLRNWRTTGFAKQCHETDPPYE